MRVAIFFDGKNFHSGLRDVASGARLDFPRLAGWLVERAGGDVLWSAHYYTGIERGEAAQSEGQQGLVKFLDVLELQPGFFVHRFPRKAERRTCPHCGETIRFSQEKEVDTTIVADMLRLAAVDGFDILVLVSGDADLAPAVENVRSLGKKVFVATWGLTSLAKRLRQAAFDHIDLRDGLRASLLTLPVTLKSDGLGGLPHAERSPAVDPVGGLVPPLAAAPSPGVSVVPTTGENVTDEEGETVFLAALADAETKFTHGYVGLHFFLNNWRYPNFDPGFAVRQRLLDQAKSRGLVEVYQVADGSLGIRCRPV
jgi:uncharacterized LabA/DUF88 family protein